MPLFLFAHQLSVVPPQQLFVLGAHLKRSGRFGKEESIHPLYGQLQLIPKQLWPAPELARCPTKECEECFSPTSHRLL